MTTILPPVTTVAPFSMLRVFVPTAVILSMPLMFHRDPAPVTVTVDVVPVVVPIEREAPVVVNIAPF
nr:hypothetical protein [Bradyrhizobium sp. th.b2]